jgi:hypothetical protein
MWGRRSDNSIKGAFYMCAVERAVFLLKGSSNAITSSSTKLPFIKEAIHHYHVSTS